MKYILLIVAIFAPTLGLSSEVVEQPEAYFNRAMKIELHKPQVAGGVVYFLEDGVNYFDHRIAAKVAKDYFRIYQKSIDVDQLIKALDSDDVFVRDSSFEVIKLIYPKIAKENETYSPFGEKKRRAESIEKLRKKITKSEETKSTSN